jgi:hypothetical protein
MYKVALIYPALKTGNSRLTTKPLKTQENNNELEIREGNMHTETAHIFARHENLRDNVLFILCMPLISFQATFVYLLNGHRSRPKHNMHAAS